MPVTTRRSVSGAATGTLHGSSDRRMLDSQRRSPRRRLLASRAAPPRPLPKLAALSDDEDEPEYEEWSNTAKRLISDLAARIASFQLREKAEKCYQQVLSPERVFIAFMVLFVVLSLVYTARQSSSSSLEAPPYTTHLLAQLPSFFSMEEDSSSQRMESATETPAQSAPDWKMLILQKDFVDFVRNLTRFELDRFEERLNSVREEKLKPIQKFLDDINQNRAEDKQTFAAILGKQDTLNQQTKEDIGNIRMYLNNQLKDLEDKIENISNSEQDYSDTLLSKKESIEAVEKRLENIEDSYSSMQQKVAQCCQQNLQVKPLVETAFQDWLSALHSKNSSNPEAVSFISWLEKHYLKKDFKGNLERLLPAMKEDIREEMISTINSEVQKAIKQSISSPLRGSTDPAVGESLSTLSEADVSRIVQDALKKYDADKTGMFDFALESAGGTIVTTRCTETHDVSTAIYSVFGVPFWWERNTPRTMLQPGSSPGQCWAFKGSHGAVVIRLSRPIHIQAVTLEHISPLVSLDGTIASAPKSFAVFGLDTVDDETPTLLGNFTYVNDGRPVQTFYMPDYQSVPFDLIELKILSNHGHGVYTCIYRFRVHGKLFEAELPNNDVQGETRHSPEKRN